MSARAHLKEASAQLHAQVDEAFAKYPLSTRDGYQRFLQAHAWALSRIEPTIEREGIADILPDWPERRRREAINEDLAALGATAPGPAPIVITLDAPALWGVAYVLEGSRLGARYLSRAVQGAEFDESGPPLAYLTHGQEAGLWPQFIKRLESVSDSLDQARVLEGVHWCFSVFLDAARLDPGR
ncbi:biliverdin-producing heme oxygenase [Pseudomonas sp. Marseille-QA0892]